MKINVTSEQFISLILIYLLDKINNPDEMEPHSDEFDKVVRKLDQMKPVLTQYYLGTDINDRIYYKRIRDAFRDTDYSTDYVINIIEGKMNESGVVEDDGQDIDFYKFKSLLKKSIKLINKRKFHKGKYLSEEALDKIIDKVLKEEQQ